ncbi:hypothetical protein pb186bvf_017509 [Paramecium bursaria]
MKQIKFNIINHMCICNSYTSAPYFKCMICNEIQHLSCYGYGLLDLTPQFKRCFKCQLNAYDPFHEVIEFINLKGKKAFKIDAQVPLESKYFKLDFQKYIKELKMKTLSAAIVCTKIKDPKKLYEWPSNNIFIEIDQKHHITYKQYHYAKIPSSLLNKDVNIMFQLLDPPDELSLIACAILKPVDNHQIRSFLIDQVNEIYVKERKKQYKNKLKDIKQINSNELQLDQSLPVRIKDQLTFELLKYPIRGRNCQHLDCFELEYFIQFNEKPNNNRWQCPVCQQLTPKDQIIIDVVLLNTINNIEIKFPYHYSQISKIAFFDEDLRYQVIEPPQVWQEMSIFKQQFKSSKNFSCTFKFNEQLFTQQCDIQSKQDFYRCVKSFVSKEQGSKFEIYNARKLFETLKQKNILKQITSHIQRVELFTSIFVSDNNFQQSSFEDSLLLNQLVSFEKIIKKLRNFTISGLFAEYCNHFDLPSETIIKDFIVFSYQIGQQQLNYLKLIEVILAFSYKQPHYSPGFYINKLISTIFKNEQEQIINFIRMLIFYFPNVFYCGQVAQLVLFRNCQCIADLFTGLTLEQITTLYEEQPVTSQQVYKMQFIIVLYLIQVNKYREMKGILMIQEHNQKNAIDDFWRAIDLLESYNLKPLAKHMEFDYWKANQYVYLTK